MAAKQELIIKIGTDGKAQVVGDLQQVSGAVKHVAKETKTASDVMKGAFGAIASSFLVLKGLELGKSMLQNMMQANSFLESSVTQLKVLTKSATEARSMLADLKRFADITPFETSDIVMAGKQLTAFGLNYKAWLRDAGDLAAGMSSNSAEMKQNLMEIIGHLGRIKSGQMGEAFQQLRRFGIDPVAIGIADLKGNYTKDIDKALNAVRDHIRKNFAGMMDEMSRTWQGTMSNLRAHAENASAIIGREFFDKMKVEGQGLLSWLDRMRDSGQLEKWAKRTGENVADVAEAMVNVGKGISESIKQWNDLDDGTKKFIKDAIAAGGIIWGLTQITNLMKNLAATKTINLALDLSLMLMGKKVPAGILAKILSGAGGGIPGIVAGLATGAAIEGATIIETRRAEQGRIESSSDREAAQKRLSQLNALIANPRKNQNPYDVKAWEDEIKEIKKKFAQWHKNETLGRIEGGFLSKESAEKWNKLIDDAAKLGIKIRVNSAFRTYAEQAAEYAKNPRRAAKPGTSIHEIGGAVDADVIAGDRETFYALAASRGFKQTVAGEEWHFEDVGAGKGAESLYRPGQRPGKASESAKKIKENYSAFVDSSMLAISDVIEITNKWNADILDAYEKIYASKTRFETYAEMYESGPYDNEGRRRQYDEAQAGWRRQEAIQRATEYARGAFSEAARQAEETQAAQGFIRSGPQRIAEILGFNESDFERLTDQFSNAYEQFLDGLMQGTASFSDFMENTWAAIRRYIAEALADQAFKPLAEAIAGGTMSAAGSIVGVTKGGGTSLTAADKEKAKAEGTAVGDRAATKFLPALWTAVQTYVIPAVLGTAVSYGIGALLNQNKSTAGSESPVEAATQSWETSDIVRMFGRTQQGALAIMESITRLNNQIEALPDDWIHWTERHQLETQRDQLWAQITSGLSDVSAMAASAFGSAGGELLAKIEWGAVNQDLPDSIRSFYGNLMSNAESLLKDIVTSDVPGILQNAINNTRTVIQEFVAEYNANPNDPTLSAVWKDFLSQFYDSVLGAGTGTPLLTVTNPFTQAITRAVVGAISTASDAASNGAWSTTATTGTIGGGAESGATGTTTTETGGTTTTSLVPVSIDFEALYEIMHSDSFDVNLSGINVEVLSRLRGLMTAAAETAGTTTETGTTTPTGGASTTTGGGVTVTTDGGTTTITTGGTTSPAGGGVPIINGEEYQNMASPVPVGLLQLLQGRRGLGSETDTTYTLGSDVQIQNMADIMSTYGNWITSAGGNWMAQIADAMNTMFPTEGRSWDVAPGFKGVTVNIASLQISPNATGSIDKAIVAGTRNYTGFQDFSLALGAI